MEILIVTSAYTTREHNTDVLAQVQWIADTLPNAPGLISSHFYRNRENSSSYLMFTTWEDEESWQKAQERYNPKTLLQNSAARLLAEPPEQWRMHYQWGYNRPAVTPTVIAVHLATVPPHQAEAGQQKWLNELRKQDLKLSLGFAFLARGEREEAAANKEKPPFAPAILENHVNPIGSVFLNFFSWSSETACRRFYASSAYKELDIFMRSINAVQQVLFLESMR
jgi:heme-degrading monooxygenase HmoA